MEHVLFAPGKRKIDYLRISVTDRCNMRCIYCMPSEGIKTVTHNDILSYEEIYRFAKIAVRAGISRIRLTGGEPLVRKGISQLVGYLSTIESLKDISMTTNGILLPVCAEALRTAGLRRINISVDSLDPATFRRMTRGGDLRYIYRAIECAIDTGFSPVKINVVVLKGINEDIEQFIELAAHYPVHVRFIEFMPGKFGEAFHTVSSAEMLEKLNKIIPLEKSMAPPGGGPAQYFTFPGCLGSIGFISPMSRHFCHRCNRLRLTADGSLIPCLFSTEKIYIRDLLAKTDEEITEAVLRALQKKPYPGPDGVKFLKQQMSCTGG